MLDLPNIEQIKGQIPTDQDVVVIGESSYRQWWLTAWQAVSSCCLTAASDAEHHTPEAGIIYSGAWEYTSQCGCVCGCGGDQVFICYNAEL